MHSLEEKLFKAEKNLKDIKADYERFAYIISHDFRAPFRQIDGFSKILASRYQDKLDDDAKKYFSLIISGVEQCHKNLESALELSRTSINQLDYKDVNLNDLIDVVLNHLQDEVSTCKPKIEYPSLPTIKADFEQLAKLFYHVIKNAIIYKKDRNSITIDSIQNEHDWQFCISDNGIGIDKNIIDEVFVAMYKGIRLKEFQGQGIGLAVSKNVINNHGGKIWIESQKDIGTKIFFTIPIKV